jgi:hypothetical protein
MEEALLREITEIASLSNPYNVSPGGELDWMAGCKALAEKLKDPVWREEYGRRLSDGLLRSYNNGSRSREAQKLTLDKWRRDNPKEAYKHARRALRIALRTPGNKSHPGRSEEWKRAHGDRVRNGIAAAPKSVKLCKKRNSRKAAIAQWAARSDAEKSKLSADISASVARHHANKTPNERRAHESQLAQARKNIDHTFRKARQKAALKAYWTPERRAAFGEKVRARNAAKKASQ